MSEKKSLWNNVKIEHVEEALRRYIPKSRKRKIDYYIVANNCKYPARQIRQVAYEIANGVECTSEDINRKGGNKAKEFFEGIVGFKERGYICINIHDVSNSDIEIINKLEDPENIFEEISMNNLIDYLKQYELKIKDKQVTSIRYDRNKVLSFWVKEIAAGVCQLCENEAPFKDKNAKPYLETHHIIPLSNGGLDNINNTVALCPNCHRKMHSLGLDEDVKKLLLIAKDRKL